MTRNVGTPIRLAICTDCGKSLILTKTGRFRKHLGKWPIREREQPVCPGTGKEPRSARS